MSERESTIKLPIEGWAKNPRKVTADAVADDDDDQRTGGKKGN